MFKNFLFLLLLLSFGLFGCKSDSGSSTDNATSKTSVEKSNDTPILKEVDEYRQIDDTTLVQLNELITKKKLSSPIAVLNAYAPKNEKVIDTDYSYDVTRMNSEEGIVLLLLVEEGIHDDALRAKRILMRIDNTGKTLKVVQIKESYKCWEWRGSQEWSSERCY